MCVCVDVHVREKDTAGLPCVDKNRWVPKDFRHFQLTHHSLLSALTSLQLIMLMVQGWCNTCGKWRGTYYIICPVSFGAWNGLKLLNTSVDKIWALILIPKQMFIFQTFYTCQLSWFHNTITFHFIFLFPNDYSFLILLLNGQGFHSHMPHIQFEAELHKS